MAETVFSINGSIVPEKDAVVPVTDRGFLYGDGVFETLHAYGAKLFRLEQHLQRLDVALNALAIRGVPPRATLRKWLNSAVRASGFPEGNVRMTVTRGVGTRGPSIKGAVNPFIVIMVSAFGRRPERDYTEGVIATMASFRRQEGSVIARLKTTAYIEQIFAKQEADQAGADEALLLNNAGLLCEGSSSNITLVRNGSLIAPDSEIVGALPGIAQLVAFELAHSLHIPVQRVGLGPWDLRACDEAFLSGSMRELTPLVRVGKDDIGVGKPGPVTRRLIAAYRGLVERECRGYRYKPKFILKR